MGDEEHRPDLTGFNRVFEKFSGFDVLFDPAMVTDYPTHLALIAMSLFEIDMPCFGRFGFGVGWSRDCYADVPLCQKICQRSSKCFDEFLDRWGEETEPEVLGLVRKFDKGPGHSPKCRVTGIDEEFNKLGFRTNPVWKAIGDNAEEGHESAKKLSELIRLN